MKVRRKFKAQDVVGVLAEEFLKKGLPVHLRSDNGPEFTAKAVREWLEKFGVKNLFIEPGSPWENGYNESFNGKENSGTSCSMENSLPASRRHKY